MKLLASAPPPPPPTVVYSVDDRVRLVGMKRPYVVASPADVGPVYMEHRQAYPRARMELADTNQPMVVESSRPSYPTSYGGTYLSSSLQHSSTTSTPPVTQGTPPSSFQGGSSSHPSGSYTTSYGTSYGTSQDFGTPSSEPFSSGGGGGYSTPSSIYGSGSGPTQPPTHTPGSFGSGGGGSASHSSHF